MTGGTSSNSSRSQIELAAIGSDGWRASILACMTSHMIPAVSSPGAFGKEFLRVVVGLDNRLVSRLALS